MCPNAQRWLIRTVSCDVNKRIKATWYHYIRKYCIKIKTENYSNFFLSRFSVGLSNIKCSPSVALVLGRILLSSNMHVNVVIHFIYSWTSEPDRFKVVFSINHYNFCHIIFRLDFCRPVPSIVTRLVCTGLNEDKGGVLRIGCWNIRRGFLKREQQISNLTSSEKQDVLFIVETDTTAINKAEDYPVLLIWKRDMTVYLCVYNGWMVGITLQDLVVEIRYRSTTPSCGGTLQKWN